MRESTPFILSGPRLKAAFAEYEITSTFECTERLVAGDLAVDRGWDIQVRSRSGGEAMVNRQRLPAECRSRGRQRKRGTQLGQRRTNPKRVQPVG
jgi:hypothetical protein